ncbi:MAG: polyphenol oxidase family protein [Gemmatimonadota bacterium]
MATLDALRCDLGFPAIRYLDQVHGSEVLEVSAGAAGTRSVGRADGLLTADPEVLLGITVADCVPVFLVDPGRRHLALLHAGWRGVAAGILERGLAALESLGSAAASLRCHLGPAICGRCYEVGPEVLIALGRRSDGARTVDLRDELARRARDRGVATAGITRSAWCTRCGGGRFASHRGQGASAGRMVAFLGWAADAVANDRDGP